MAAPSKTLSGEISVKNREGYSYTLKYEVGMLPGGTEDVANAKPGQALVKWTSGGSGQISMTNTTAGHTLPWPQFAIRLAAFYPKSSLVCTVKLEDPRHNAAYLNFPSTETHHGPAGGQDAWCGVDMATQNGLVDTKPLGIGATAQGVFVPTGGDLILQSEQDYEPLMKALKDDATAWGLVGWQKNGITSPSPPTPECWGDSFVYWSSVPLTDCL